MRSRGKSDEREREISFEELPYFMTPKVNGRWRICRDVIFKNAKKGASDDGEGRE